MIKRIGLFSALLFLSLNSVAGGYIEANYGYAFIEEIELDGSIETGDAGTISDYKLDYDDTQSFGFELGFTNLIDSPLRIGASWDRLELELDEVSARASGGSGMPAGRFSASAKELKAVGIDYDGDVNVYSLNGYYDVWANESFAFYAGGGIGTASIDGADGDEFSWSLAAGARYKLNDAFSLGLLYKYFKSEDFTGEDDLDYSGIEANRLSLTLTYSF